MFILILIGILLFINTSLQYGVNLNVYIEKNNNYLYPFFVKQDNYFIIEILNKMNLTEHFLKCQNSNKSIVYFWFINAETDYYVN